ncbi:MAG: twin-arginine translocase subunit TatC [Bacteroidetes bacterium]|nr:MAG: twin-arginine translocase subunit TatC [Bacteroidota bacterium]
MFRKRKNADKEEMTFWEHLDELRSTLIWSIVAIAVCGTVAFIFKDILFDHILLAPKEKDFITYTLLCKLANLVAMPSLCIDPSSFQIININLAGQFMSHMTISLVAGLILSMPFVVWQFWRFIKPGLTDKEVRHTRGAVAVISLLFLTGVLFSYFIVVPLMVNFLGGYQVSEMVTNQIALSSYTGSITMMTLLMGLLFELPIVVIFLTKAGILTPSYLKKYRKHTVVAILIIAGVITPSPDIFSQLIVAIPLYVLFEASVSISFGIYKRKQLELAAREGN